MWRAWDENVLAAQVVWSMEKSEWMTLRETNARHELLLFFLIRSKYSITLLSYKSEC